MKVFISIDMEGISGVCVEAQTDRGHPAYARAREFMRADLDAVLAGCVDAGAGEVVVRDAHDYCTNVDIGGLPENVSLVCGATGPLGMMEGIDGTFDAALFVGYHARAGTMAAVLDHTFWGIVAHAFVGDLELGESGFNAGVAGHFGVPVAFASGDDKLALEAAACIPGITTVVTKQGVARNSARLLSAQVTAGLIHDGAKRALSSAMPAPVDFAGQPVRLVFVSTQHADGATQCSTVRRIDGRTVEIAGADFAIVYQDCMAALSLAGHAT